MLKKYLASTLAVLLVAAGAVFGLAAPASAHTGDMSHEAVCNPATGQYDVTTTLHTSNTPGGLTGTVKSHVGGSNFAGAWNEGTFTWDPPLTTTLAPNASVSFSYSIPGTSVNGPWVYTWTEWSNNVPTVTYEFGSDGRIEGLGGDCTQPKEAEADWDFLPATCAVGETLVVNNANLVNATWNALSLSYDGKVGPGEYDLTAVLDQGAVWADGQTGQFHVVLKGPKAEADCKASASVKFTLGTCQSPGSVMPDTVVNATFGEPQIDQNGHYTIVATRTGEALFSNPGQDGVSQDGTTKTFTGQVSPKLTEVCVATAQVTLNPGNCTEQGTVQGGDKTNATWGDVSYDYQNGTYSMTATRTGVALFANPGQNGVSADGTQKTFTGPIPPTEPEDCKIVPPKKPWVKDEKCVEGQPTDGSIEVKFGELGDKIKFEITGGDLEDPITINYGDAHKVSLPAGDYTVTAIAIEPWVFGEGTNWWNVTIDDAECKVYPEPADWMGEICVDGETAQGWIAVDYSGYLADQIQYRITGEDGFNEVVSADGDWTYYDLDAGTYTVSVEPLYDWVEVQGDDFPVEFTITSATNCICFVPDLLDEQTILLDGDINPICADAKVSVTPPTCISSGQLKLGDHPMATWGVPSIVGLHYEVTATADGGYRFAPGDGVSDDGFTKTFEGDLPPAAGACGELTTLALTGTGSGNLPWIAGLALLLGIGGVLVASRRRADGVPTE